MLRSEIGARKNEHKLSRNKFKEGTGGIFLFNFSSSFHKPTFA